MATEVLMPKMGLTMTEGTIEEWKFKEGDTVKKGDILFSVATDKLTNDVECDTDGVLLKILLPEGETGACKSVIAYIGQIHPEVMDNYNMKGEVYVAVIDMPTLVPKATFDRKYEGVAKFPAMKRDLSMVMKKDIFVGQLEKIFKDKGGKLLESYELFDVYEGDQIEKGYKSVAYSLTFRAKDRTLEDAEVSKIVEKILDELKKLGVELRA